jgi:hypothetical protein
LHVQAQNLTGFALGGYLKRAAANLAVGGEALGTQTGIDDHFVELAAIRARDGVGFFHGESYTDFCLEQIAFNNARPPCGGPETPNFKNQTPNNF